MAPVLIALTIALPWVGALAVWWVGDRYPRWQHALAVAFAAAGGIAALALLPFRSAEVQLSLPVGGAFGEFTFTADGLGAQAMTGGSFKDPFFAVAWPTAEFGGMGLEGQVKLGFRNELANITDPKERLERYETLVARAYERSRAIHQGVSFQVDDVIDPADTRFWVSNGLRTVPPPAPRQHKKRPNVDTW